MDHGLLEGLSEQLGVPYLSDLRMKCHRGRLVRELETVKAGDYSLAEWRDAIQYLLGKTEGPVGDQKAAKTYLTEHLTEQNA